MFLNRRPVDILFPVALGALVFDKELLDWRVSIVRGSPRQLHSPSRFVQDFQAVGRFGYLCESSTKHTHMSVKFKW